VKKFTSGILALVLALMPAAAFAEEGSGNTTESGTAPRTESQAQQAEIVADWKLTPDEDEGIFGIMLNAELKDATNVDGTWTVKKEGTSYTDEFKGSRIENKFIVLGPGGQYTVNIQFAGIADGKEVMAEKTVNVIVPGLKANHEEKSGKHEIGGMIEYAKHAKGSWHIDVRYPGDFKGFVEVNVDNVEGLSFAHAFDLKPGKYEGVVTFKGEVDGEHVFLSDWIHFEVKADGNGNGGNDNGGNNGGYDNGNNGRTTPPSHQPSGQSGNGKNNGGNSKQGGKLPKTATAYPAAATAGLALLAGGLVLLKLRRIS
jgi:LPXTG-motif cell wall-anchored protein